MFFQGRHNNVTLLLAVQNDKTVCPTIRGQAFFSFFCTPRILEQFGNGNNGMDKKMAKTYADRMRANVSENERVVFVRQTNTCIPFKPTKHLPQKFGSATVWALCSFLENAARN